MAETKKSAQMPLTFVQGDQRGSILETALRSMDLERYFI